MKKKRRHHKTHSSSVNKKTITLFILIMGLLLLFVYKNQHQAILGATSESGQSGQIGTGGQGESTPVPIKQPTAEQPTSVPLPTSEPIRPTTVPITTPSPTPTLITPQEPVYVPVNDISTTAPDTVNIAAENTTVVIESTPTGLTTTSEQLVSHTIPVSDQPSQPIVQQYITPTTLLQQSEATNQPILYQQVYVSENTAASYTTDPQQTFAAMNEWLGLNNMAIASSKPGIFNISQGVYAAEISPIGNKIAVNLSRMEVLINTRTGFKPLSNKHGWAIDYLITLNIISRVNAAVVIRDTPTDLVYDIKGISDQYLFAFIPIPIEKQVCISARTNEVCGIQQSLLSKVLDYVSL